MEEYATIEVVCACRVWEVFAGVPWGTCGYCGILPVRQLRAQAIMAETGEMDLELING